MDAPTGILGASPLLLIYMSNWGRAKFLVDQAAGQVDKLKIAFYIAGLVLALLAFIALLALLIWG